MDRQTGSRLRPTRWWLMGGVVLLLLAILTVTYHYRQREMPDAEARKVEGDSARSALARMASTDQVPAFIPGMSQKGAGQTELENFRAGMRKYADGDYAEAISSLEDAARADPDHLPAAFYLGIAYLVSERLDDSIQELARVTSKGANPYLEEGHWYLAKAYLKKGDHQAARRELESVAGINGLYSGEAKKALELLERISQ